MSETVPHIDPPGSTRAVKTFEFGTYDTHAVSVSRWLTLDVETATPEPLPEPAGSGRHG